MLVTVTPSGRIDRVDLPRLDDDLRDPARLSDAVRAAHHAALAGPRGRVLPRPLPRPRSLVAPPRVVVTHPWVEGRPIAPVDSEWARAVLATRPGAVTGRSANDCVGVTLAPGSSAGTVDADAGWLRRAAPHHVAAALTEAFTDAYRKRDGR